MSIAAYPKYESYRDSGVQWVGAIPSSWSVRRGKWLFKKMDRPVRVEDEIVTCFRDGVVTLRANRRTEGFTNALKEHGYQGIRKGDLVIHAMDAFAGAVGVSDSEGKSTPVYSACVPRIEGTVDPHFYAYYMRHIALSGLLVAMAKGIRERSTDFRFNDFADLALAAPSVEEQTAIVAFLDGKCAKIDEAVRIKEAQIKLLAERRQILIQQAVTRGLNPDAPMKDSRIDWIGQIPAHWEVSKLKYVLDTWTGYAFSSGAFASEGVPVIRIGDLIALGNVTTEKAVCLPETYMSFDTQFGVRQGDILMAMTGGTIGKVSVYASDKPALLNQRVCAFRSKGKLPLQLALYWMQTRTWEQHILLNSEGGAQPNISDKATIEMPIVFPPRNSEIQDVVNFIQIATGKIDKAISTKKDQIAALNEYKTSLINAAVTGKIKVI